MASESSHTFRSENFQNAGYAFFRNIRHQQEFCDVTFNIDGKAVSAHRIVIAAAIPYYRKLLSNNNGANEENGDEKEFVMPAGFDPGAFENLVEFAYSGELIISDENAKCLLSVAWHLDIREVIQACCEFLVNSLNPENVFQIRDFACDLLCEELLKDVDDYICENFSEISQMEEFCSLPLQCLEELIGRDDLRVSCEEKAFTSVMKWVNKCPEQRKATLAELLKKIRLNLIDPHYLKDHVASQPLIHESIPCRDLLDEARNYHLFPNDRITLSNVFSEPRCKTLRTKSFDDKESMYTISADFKYTAQRFNQQEQTWKSKVGSVFYHKKSSSAVVDTKIYYFHNGQTVEYDPSKNVFKRCKNLHYYKYHYGTAAVNGNIYLCGGRNTSCLKTVDCYVPKEDKWRNVNDMRKCRAAPGATTLAECVYVLGGRNGTSVHRSVEKFDVNSRKWKTVTSMLTARQDFGCTTLNGRIYVCGGITTGSIYTSTAEMYDPMENKWVAISSVNTVRCTSKLLPYHGKLYAIGGKDANGSQVYGVEIYDPDSDKWKFGKEMSHDYIIAAVEVISLPRSTKGD